ncbi:hypothetical protein ACFLUH_01145 [Chloroflexota bacterium]
MKKKSLALFIVLALVLSLVLSSVPTMAAEDTSSGTFSNNNPPSIDYVKLYDTETTPAEVSAMTPQVEYNVRVKVTDADALADLTTIVVKVWYDADGGTPTSGEYDAIAAGNAQTAIIITYTQGTPTWELTEEADSSWDLGTCVEPGDLSGEFQFKFTAGKVATETATANGWQVAAKVTDDSAETDWDYDAQGSTMAWYGEINVPDSNTVDWGLVNPGMDWAEGDPSEESLGVTVNYISNGAYDEKVKSSATWTGSATATLSADAGAANQFALKADDDDTLTDAVVVDATGVTIDDAGTLTAEAGDDAANNSLWLKLNATFTKAVYTGTLTYIIADGS